MKKGGVLRNFTKFTGKHLCQSLFFNKVAVPAFGLNMEIYGVKIGVKIFFFTEYLRATTSPAGNYMFKFNNKNARTRCEIRSKLKIKIPERRHWHRSGIFIVFIVNFEHISHLILVFLLLTLSR